MNYGLLPIRMVELNSEFPPSVASLVIQSSFRQLEGDVCSLLLFQDGFLSLFVGLVGITKMIY